jgi:phytanoyl-CoA hydroxylase
MHLSNTQLNSFINEGYLVLDHILDDNDLQPVIDEISSEIEVRSRELLENGDISNAYENEGFETRLSKISEQSPKLAVSIWNEILHGPAIFNLITNDKILDVAESLCGEELIASSVYRLRPKIPNYGYGEVPWHQDSGYFEPYCDDSLVLTMWIPLVNTSVENGCLFVIPGSHQSPVVEHEMHESGKYLAIKEELVPQDNWVACPVPKGGALLLNNRTMHASFRNSTDGVRWSMDLRYQNASLPTNAKISNSEGGKESIDSEVPSACYPPDADFLVRSKTRPSEILKTYEEFKDLRERFIGKPVTNRFNVYWQPMQVSDL